MREGGAQTRGTAARAHAASSSEGRAADAARVRYRGTPLASRSYPSGRVPARSHQRERKRRPLLGRRRGQRRCEIPHARGICVRGPDELAACIRAPRSARLCTSFAHGRCDVALRAERASRERRWRSRRRPRYSTRLMMWMPYGLFTTPTSLSLSRSDRFLNDGTNCGIGGHVVTLAGLRGARIFRDRPSSRPRSSRPSRASRWCPSRASRARHACASSRADPRRVRRSSRGGCA